MRTHAPTLLLHICSLFLGIAQGAQNTTIHVPGGTVVGNVNEGIESFSSIPFAVPPTGNLRLRPPQRLEDSFGTVDGTNAAGACPQMVVGIENQSFLLRVIGKIANLPWTQEATGQSEDCLTVTVARPEGVKEGDKLPVLVYIYGGGYQLGWSSMYDGSGLVNYGVDIGKPFIYVIANYRVNGFGFVPGKEVLEDGASNHGLLDQRMALEWVADNIAYFGGDPSKVSIWGESAGAWSVFNQLALYGGEPKYKGEYLFRGAIMASGTGLPAQPIDSPKAQECLREVDYKTYLDAVSSAPGMLSYTSLGLSYLPRPDGDILPDSPEVLAKEGRYVRVPVITGNQEDEGTLFALFQSNLTTTDALIEYLQKYYYPSASTEQLADLIATYGHGMDTITQNSPFESGLANEIFPGFKRRAAIIGDMLFTLTRRLFLKEAVANSPDLPAWSYLSSYNYNTPILGTFHGSDILQVFFGIKDNYAAKSIRYHFINFLYHLDPNGESGSNDQASQYPFWPAWSKNKDMMKFTAENSWMIQDDFRSDSFDWLLNNTEAIQM